MKMRPEPILVGSRATHGNPAAYLKYGRRTIPVNLPLNIRFCDVVEPAGSHLPPHSPFLSQTWEKKGRERGDSEGAILRALRRPIGGPPLAEMVRGARTPTFLFNVVNDSAGEPAAYFAGHLEQAWAAGVALCRRLSSVVVAEPADLVIAGMGGFPKDISLYQSTNDYAYPAVAPGGAIILVAACEEGLGAPDFVRWLQYDTPEAMCAALRQDFSVAGYLAYRTWLQARRVPTFFVSDLPPEPVRALGMEPIASLDEAIEAALARLGPSPRVLVFPRILQVSSKDQL